MLKSHFKYIARSLWKRKVFTIINIAGLAIAFSTCILISLYVFYESGYDGYHKNASRIYRLVAGDNKTTGSRYSADSPAVGPALQRECAGIEAMARISFRSALVKTAIYKFQEDHMLYADSALFSIFDFPLIKGNQKSALTLPFTVVLSETAARKYFGDSNPIGKILMIDESNPAYGNYTVTVTGVIRDMPADSHFTAGVIVSMCSLTQSLEKERDNLWESPIGHTYLLLSKGYSQDELQKALDKFATEHKDKILLGDRSHFSLTTERLTDIYLRGLYAGAEHGNRANLYILSIIALLVLIIAGLNFINLSSAIAFERIKQISIHKIIGSSRQRLILHFLGESVLICLSAFFIACFVSSLLIPFFNALCGKTISHGLSEHTGLLFLFFGVSLLFALLTGLFPAIILTSFKPAMALKGKILAGTANVTFRQGLVVSQFVISILLIVGTIVVYLQLNYLRNQPLGFKKEQMLVIDFHGDPKVKSQVEAIKNELKKFPAVHSVSASSGIPNSGFEPADYDIENRAGAMQRESMPLYMVDENFFQQYGIKLLSGRAFSTNFPGDFKDALIVNEAALAKLGYRSPAEIIGKRFSGEGQGTVIGVIKNFNFQSLRDQVSPLIFRTFFLANRYLTLNISSVNSKKTISSIAQTWNKLEPQRPFDYFFLDEAINKQYRSEENFGKLVFYFGSLALLISCMGLFGLSLFSLSQRTKEIAIRKTLGAGVTSIIRLLTTGLLRPVLIAMFIASPLSWYIMNKWLLEFAYRIVFPGWILLPAGFVVAIIALCTILFRVINAAMQNPAKSLRAD